MSAEKSVVQERAFRNAVDAIDVHMALPRNVFRGLWKEFHFFESDRLFSAGYIDAIRCLLDGGGAQTCCLINLNAYLDDHSGAPKSCSIFLDASSDAQTYISTLREGGPARGWLFGMDRYSCASDLGDWVVYCEKENDVAVLASRIVASQAAPIQSFLSKLGALSASKLGPNNRDMPFPFSQLTPEWRDSLLKEFAPA